MVERLLAKEKVAGSNPVFRSRRPYLAAVQAQNSIPVMLSSPEDALRKATTDALQRAKDGIATLDDVAAICADAALRAGLDCATIKRMTTSLHTDPLQRRLDDLVPPRADSADDDLMPLPDAARACGVNPRTVKNWLRSEKIRSHGDIPTRGGRSAIVSKRAVEVVRDYGDHVGGRPRKT